MKQKKVEIHNGRLAVPKLKIHINGHLFAFDYNNLTIDKGISLNLTKRNIKEMKDYFESIFNEMIYYNGYS